MKLRIKGNSIRLRLDSRELEHLASVGSIHENVDFGPGQPSFAFELRIASTKKVAARFDGSRISVEIPAAEAEDWLRSERVGIESTQPIAENAELRILVEKDFACRSDGAEGYETEAFANPMSGKC
jgi:hypothetical protein